MRSRLKQNAPSGMWLFSFSVEAQHPYLFSMDRIDISSVKYFVRQNTSFDNGIHNKNTPSFADLQVIFEIACTHEPEQPEISTYRLLDNWFLFKMKKEKTLDMSTFKQVFPLFFPVYRKYTQFSFVLNLVGLRVHLF